MFVFEAPEDGGDRGHRELGREHHALAIVSIGDDTTQQGQRHDRDHAGEPHHAEGQRGPRQKVDVPVDRGGLHLGPGQGDELGAPEPAKISMPQRKIGAHRPTLATGKRGHSPFPGNLPRIQAF